MPTVVTVIVAVIVPLLLTGVLLLALRSRRRKRGEQRGRLALTVHKALGDIEYVERRQAEDISAPSSLRWVPDPRGGLRLAGDYLPPEESRAPRTPPRRGRRAFTSRNR